MKLIIAGCRHIQVSDEQIDMAIDEFPSEVVCGMARGVDLCGKRWAENRGIPVKEFPADWDMLGKAAGPARNGSMARYADALLVVWDGKSKGTANMIKQARELGLSVKIMAVA